MHFYPNFEGFYYVPINKEIFTLITRNFVVVLNFSFYIFFLKEWEYILIDTVCFLKIESHYIKLYSHVQLIMKKEKNTS